ncbi:hypothetical protein STCU_05343 [Strigomonas culicis]|uniref:Cleavage stimulation factor subunit 2 n=1 Tax=Strigomonas culicis TaxID=28005 RepID=S9VLG2_9TRYP|nr:hypothetical protein STCU_05343 [Strigomonas culicis]|eukprot:EPY28016.1 hypothetical protein STCU_05343 [Strigomonas culicis]
MDEKTAAEAVSRLNGMLVGSQAIRVSLAQQGRNQRRRRREDGGGSGGGGGPPTDREGRALMRFPRFFQDPLLGPEESPVVHALRAFATEEAYEAVEQLRVLAIERRADAKLLLEEKPALTAAVVCILQHAGKLPDGQLPPAAFEAAQEEPAVGNSRRENEAVAPAAPETSQLTKEDTDEVLSLLDDLPDEEIGRISCMTDADLAKITDPMLREQMGLLRDRLVEMINGLK